MVTAVRETPAVENDDDFESFYAAAFHRIAGQLFVVTGDMQDAEDVTQEAFALAEELRALPLSWRKAIVLHHLVGMPVEEAARTPTSPAGRAAGDVAAWPSPRSWPSGWCARDGWSTGRRPSHRPPPAWRGPPIRGR